LVSVEGLPAGPCHGAVQHMERSQAKMVSKYVPRGQILVITSVITMHPMVTNPVP
jgi:hypothetical protein